MNMNKKEMLFRRRTVSGSGLLQLCLTGVFSMPSILGFGDKTFTQHIPSA